MSNEREMLEHAAKACGLFDRGEWFDTTDGPVFVVGNKPFNPLTNSSDCAAMCAKMKIDTLWTDDCIICGDDSRTYESEVPLDDDPEAAWRYSATMVAAKIGGMK